MRVFTRVSIFTLSPRDTDDNYAQLCTWFGRRSASAGIVGLLIKKDGVRTYFSFYPESMVGVADRPVGELMSGKPAGVMTNYEDALLVEGLRFLWQGMPRERLGEAQWDFLEQYHPDKAKVRAARHGNNDHRSLLTLLGDGLKLQFARTFDARTQQNFRELGAPTNAVKMYTLDLECMLAQIRLFNANLPLFAPSAGTLLHSPNTENCASIIAKILEVGGANAIAPPRNDQVGLMYGIPVMGIAYLCGLDLTTIVEAGVAGVLTMRFVGGAIEGTSAGISFSRMMVAEGKRYAVPAGMALTTLNALLSGVIGSLSTGRPADKLLVLPEMLLNHAKEIAEKERENCHVSLSVRAGFVPSTTPPRI